MSVHKDPPYIRISKHYCQQAGMNPNDVKQPNIVMTSEELMEKREEYNEILEVVSFFSYKLLKALEGTPILLVMSDKDGFILDIVGDESIKEMVTKLGICLGAQFTEEEMGTNVISLALKHRHPIQLIGDDHYYRFLHDTACYGVSFHYTDIDNLLGSLSIMTTTEQQNPLFLNMLSNVVDSIERELLLRKQNRKLNILNQIMLRRTRNAIIITNEDGTVTEFNQFAETISGNNRDDIIGRNILDSSILGLYFEKVIEDEHVFKDVELKFTNQKGEDIVALFDAQPIYDHKNAKMIGSFAQLRDITERYMMEEKYNYLAYHDELTGLPNRRYFHTEVRTTLEEKNRDEEIALLLIDLDRFKSINDTFGHSNGDKLLISVTERVKRCLRQEDMLARISGDEFIVLLKNIGGEDEAKKVASRIIEEFQQPFIINHFHFHTTASIGIALYPKENIDIEDFMVQVDLAMYQAKAHGKNGYVFYKNDMHQDASDEFSLENHLRKALEQNEFELFYQAQINSQTGEVIGVEALLRWNHPELGMILPNIFIPLAEKIGLIVPIGEWVIMEACRQNKMWQENGLPYMKVSVNLSTQQFLKQNLVDVVQQVLQSTQLNPQFLELEITESMAMDYKYARKVIDQLRGLGVAVSIDDFGTGYSSLKNLKCFAINRIKIDKCFVMNVLHNQNDEQIVSAIIAMAHGLGVNVVAEGVENEEQLHYLHSQECYNIQGYYFMKPLPAYEFTDQYPQLVEEFKKKKEIIHEKSSHYFS
ncbi:bifunctional diguanylate cyclase/phosphodiesterase [Halalkalibacter sp. APA_J-10(15)]|uniref:putative bifunctional diguanylate cyclase/phosphodiesterase n=1 Tax=unclassified Halalkalibacter TaxID=2893063 RepID=UPI001FF1938B|nr:EAL domain-containing protein [Halalkalibacter sp. APA_J-10(15)]MCK0471080.1 EAL domain-containing protein [Halalkalibacter sp. APA_J-10(15)]